MPLPYPQIPVCGIATLCGPAGNGYVWAGGGAETRAAPEGQQNTAPVGIPSANGVYADGTDSSRQKYALVIGNGAYTMYIEAYYNRVRIQRTFSPTALDYLAPDMCFTGAKPLNSLYLEG